MEIFKCIYGELKETYGSDISIRALLCSGGFALLLISLLLKPQQPIIVINETPVIKEKK